METVKLKTLKDFRCSNNSDYSCCEDRGITGKPHAVSTEELKAAAIEWIKAFRNKEDKYDKTIDWYESRSIDWEEKIPKDCNTTFSECDCEYEWKYNEKFIKHFFNISEEDLK